jgi:hypothetical protein
MLKEWIKQNFVLAVGISLPLLLIIVFTGSVAIPRLLATPPQHKLVFSVNSYTYSGNGNNYKASYVVEDGVLKLVTDQLKDGRNYYLPILLVYDGKTDTTQQINVTLPAEISGPSKTIVEQTRNMKLDGNIMSPDGYMADASDGWYSGGLVSEIYGGGWRNNRNKGPRIKKGAATFSIDLPGNNQYYYYGSHNFQFLGWVIEERK